MDYSLPGFSVHWIFQARVLGWVAISFSNAWKWKVKVKSLSRVRLLVTPWTAAYQAPLSIGFSRQEYWGAIAFSLPLTISPQNSHAVFPRPSLGKLTTPSHLSSNFLPQWSTFLLWDFLFLNLLSFMFLPLPISEELIDQKTESAVSRMQSVIELGRVIRDRKTIPIKVWDFISILNCTHLENYVFGVFS